MSKKSTACKKQNKQAFFDTKTPTSNLSFLKSLLLMYQQKKFLFPKVQVFRNLEKNNQYLFVRDKYMFKDMLIDVHIDIIYALINHICR